jgi:hypothetical protein
MKNFLALRALNNVSKNNCKIYCQKITVQGAGLEIGSGPGANGHQKLPRATKRCGFGGPFGH